MTMTVKLERIRVILNAGAAVVAVAVAVLVAGWLIRSKPLPPTLTSFARRHTVSVVTANAHTLRVPIYGYGTVAPKNQVNIVPQVSGQLIYTHKDLLPGKVIRAGELLFEIDPTTYRARVHQVQAEARALEVALLRHEQEMVNLAERIANIERMAEIDERDYLTSKKLYEVDKVGTQRDVDVVYLKFLQRKDVLSDLNNKRALAPYITKEYEANLDAARARLAQAEHLLKNTKINCPFEARVEAVGAYRSQVVTAHLSIATLTDMDAFELSVGIDPRELRWLAESIRPSNLDSAGDEDRPIVDVQWSLPGQSFAWRGRVTRFERVEESTRTARMIVEVRHADMVATLTRGTGTRGIGTPRTGDSTQMFSIGMHCRAALPAQPLVDALAVPRRAIYDGRWVYVFEPDGDSEYATSGRLGRREVPHLRSIGDDVLVDYRGRGGTEICELRPGERVVVSPLIKPVVGMPIDLREEPINLAMVMPSHTWLVLGG